MPISWHMIIADETFAEPLDPEKIAAAIYPKRVKPRALPTLASFTTGYLLKGLAEARRRGACHMRGLGDVSFAAIKAELANRPHVPNKPEAKALRQAQAAQRGRPRPRRIPRLEEQA